MQIEVNKQLLKALQKNNLNLNTWAFLLSLQTDGDLYDLEDVENYSFVAQHLGVLGLIKLCDDETDKLYCLCQEGEEMINKIKESC